MLIGGRRFEVSASLRARLFVLLSALASSCFSLRSSLRNGCICLPLSLPLSLFFSSLLSLSGLVRVSLAPCACLTLSFLVDPSNAAAGDGHHLLLTPPPFPLAAGDGQPLLLMASG